MKEVIRDRHFPKVKVTRGVQDKPLFWDFVGKPVWDVSEHSPIYTIDLSAGFSYDIETIKQAQYAHIIDAHEGGEYAKMWLYFKEKNDANRFIKKVKNFIEENRYKHPKN